MIEEDHQSNYHNVAETRMTRFLMAIKKYGREKTDRINEDADAEEEFALAKINLEATNYNEEHFKKIDDGIKVAEKIFKSRKVNECRMQEMKVRFDMIEQIQGDVKEKLKKQAEDPTEYRKLLKQLIMQGLIKLIEEKVEIQCLRSDETLISQLISECEKDFNEICEVNTKICISKVNYLKSSDLGGVVLTSFNGRIVCDNTLKARLSYCLQLLLPEIRKLLFEESDKILGQLREAKKERDLKEKKAAA